MSHSRFQALALLPMMLGLSISASALAATAMYRSIELSQGQSVRVEPGSITETTEIRCGAAADANACMNYLILRSGTSNPDTLIRLRSACTGNSGDACVRYASERVGTSTVDRLIQIARSCTENVNSRCIAYIAERAGTSHLDRVTMIAEACRRNQDEACVSSLAERSGTSQLDRLIEFAKACANY